MTDQPVQKFGTFGGVFTPCVLTILGVIMFLRMGEVVGQAGLYQAVFIVLAAKLITTLTAFSLSAVATNTRVRGGGAYYLISRSLGVEFGSIIGIVFYLAQAISVAMYIIGFTEAFRDAFPNTPWTFREVATVVNLGVLICVYTGAGWTIRIQYGILVILVLAVLSFLAGAAAEFSLSTVLVNTQPAYRQGDSFFTMFALFFPAVTGIMAGANMSGDLHDPGKSIPLGSFTAILVTGFIYLLMVVALAGSRTQTALLGNIMIVREIAWSDILIICGVFAATLSSALTSMLGAPRILQAFARDDVIHQLGFFSRGSGRSGEPRRAILLTFCIAQAGIMLGDLDAIAPIITMFFIITYGTLNLACFYEASTHNPSYRPTFHFSHWSVALAGAVSCIVVMFLISPLWATISIFVMWGLYWWIDRLEVISRWGDLKSGVAYEQARRALLRLDEESYHPKNWRPAILALCGGAWSRFHLAQYGYWLTSGHGVLSLGHIITVDAEHIIELRLQTENRLRRFIHEEELEAFPAVVVADDLLGGLRTLLQTHGLGKLRPNTVLIGLTRDPERWQEFCECLRIAAAMEKSVLLVDCREDLPSWTPLDGSIDILWQGSRDVSLMLLLAHILRTNQIWRHRRLRILATVPPRGDTASYRDKIIKILETARIDGSVHVFSSEDLYVTLAKRTGNTAALLLPLDIPEAGMEDEFLDWVTRMSKLTPDLIMVYHAGGVSFEV